MKAWVEGDEWYPVYSLYTKYEFGIEVEVSLEFMSRYNRILDEFNKMQDELIKLYEN